MMEYADFYDISVYANENWNKGNFSPRFVACNAHCYYSDFKWSKENNEISTTIATLCENLYDDLQNMREFDRDYDDVHYWLHCITTELNMLHIESPYFKESLHEKRNNGI